MAAQLSTYAENAIGNAVYRGASLPWSNVYIGILTVITDKDTATEVTGGGYARLDLTAALAAFAAGASENNQELVFATASTNLGTAVGVGIFDASSSGNLLETQTISSFSYATNTRARIAVGALDLAFAAGS